MSKNFSDIQAIIDVGDKQKLDIVLGYSRELILSGYWNVFEAIKISIEIFDLSVKTPVPAMDLIFSLIELKRREAL